MKKSLLFFATVLLLTACSGGQTPPPQNTVDWNKPAPVAQAPAAPKGLSCDDLLSADRKTSCQALLDSTVRAAVMDEIVSTFDAKRCDSLPDANDQRSCVARIQETGVTGPVDEKTVAALKMATSNSDVAACSPFSTTPGLKEYCEKNVHQIVKTQGNPLDAAIRSGDPSRCAALGSDQDKQFCLKVLQGMK